MSNSIRILLGITCAAVAALAHARDAVESLNLSTPHFFVTLVPHRGDSEWVPGFDQGDFGAPMLRLAAPRRSRLEFAVQQRDFLTSGDQLQLRLASDAHVVAQLLSGGELSGEEEGMIAMLGVASRLKLSYSNGPWNFSLGATRKLGNGQVNARLSFAVRF